MDNELLDQIALSRPSTKAFLGMDTKAFKHPGRAAAHFGLSSKASVYREISRNRAALILAAVLRRDFAYSTLLLHPSTARSLSARFLGLFPAPARFFTNGFWDVYQSPTRKSVSRFSWIPATPFTFDGGVLVLGTARSGCIWFADED